MIVLTAYVPYNPELWAQWARSVLISVGSATGLGFVVFTALFVISLFRIVFRHFL